MAANQEKLSPESSDKSIEIIKRLIVDWIINRDFPLDIFTQPVGSLIFDLKKDEEDEGITKLYAKLVDKLGMEINEYRNLVFEEIFRAYVLKYPDKAKEFIYKYLEKFSSSFFTLLSEYTDNQDMRKYRYIARSLNSLNIVIELLRFIDSDPDVKIYKNIKDKI